ncbi:MAG TPA: DUF1616 domain-containing protein [Thermoplasmata archaeon]|nr:DUF1616 domain-containing protein [Thermoplasmata archaeon]
MSVLGGLEGVVGGLLVFFAPGYFLTKAVYPEWRIRGVAATRRLVEVVTLSFVLSIGLTILVGYGLLSAGSGGFVATWSDPVLEGALAGVAAVGLVVAVARGAFSRTPPAGPKGTPEAAEEGAWELSQELERLGRDERRLEHALRVSGSNSPERTKIVAELDSVRAERDALRRRREEEYAT